MNLPKVSETVQDNIDLCGIFLCKRIGHFFLELAASSNLRPVTCITATEPLLITSGTQEPQSGHRSHPFGEAGSACPANTICASAPVRITQDSGRQCHLLPGCGINQGTKRNAYCTAVSPTPPASKSHVLTQSTEYQVSPAPAWMRTRCPASNEGSGVG